jgi:branched-chain amino acid aminotransferase
MTAMVETSQSNLGFGQYFAPWMTSLRWKADTGWEPMQVVPMAPIPLHPAAGALQYAQAIFEGMKAFRHPDGSIKVFRPSFHRERFQQSARRVCLPPLPEGAFEEAVLESVRRNLESVPAGADEALYLRPTLIASEGFLGVRPAHECLFYVLCSPVGSYFNKGSQGLRIWVETRFSRAAAGGIGSAKAGGNYVASLLAAELAKERGFDQVLWTDSSSHNWVEEVGTMNVFFVLESEIVTPPLSDTLLNGGTRDAAIAVLRHQGREVQERPISLADLQSWHDQGKLKEAFGTGTAAVVSPIAELRDAEGQVAIELSGPQPVAQQLRRDIKAIQYGLAPDPFGWMVDI